MSEISEREREAWYKYEEALGEFHEQDGHGGTLSRLDNAVKAYAAAVETRNDDWEKCDRCGIRYPEIYWAEDNQWARVVGDTFGGLRCLACFCEEAQELNETPQFTILATSLAMRARLVAVKEGS